MLDLKRILLFLTFIFALPLFAAKPVKSLLVYTHDSLAEKGGFAAFLKETYEKKYPGKKVELVSFTSSGESVHQVMMEGKNARADVILGFDNSLSGKLVSTGLLVDLPRKLLVKLPANLGNEVKGKMVPFDFGYLAFIYDSRRTKPKKNVLSLMEFATSPEFAKKVVIEDPRTSSIGSSFLSYTRSVFSQADWMKFWMAFQKQIVRITPTWSTAYGLFLDQGADYVLSYTTSPAYHLEKEKNASFKALLFEEGQFQQWEAAAVLKSSTKQVEAFALLELLLTPEVQAAVPLKNWMFPVTRDSALPASFTDLALPLKVVSAPAMSEEERTKFIQEWALLLSR